MRPRLFRRGGHEKPMEYNDSVANTEIGEQVIKELLDVRNTIGNITGWRWMARWLLGFVSFIELCSSHTHSYITLIKNIWKLRKGHKLCIHYWLMSCVHSVPVTHAAAATVAFRKHSTKTTEFKPVSLTKICIGSCLRNRNCKSRNCWPTVNLACLCLSVLYLKT